MNRPTLEVADIIRASGDSYLERHRLHLAWQHRKVLNAIARCRTPALGGHRDQCFRCGHQAISYNSCRNRHCPKCQGNARAKWLQARRSELLPVPYFHVVFTLPHELSTIRTSRTSGCFMTCSSAPALRPCSKLRPTPSTSEPGSASSAFCIPGDRTCDNTLTHDARHYHLLYFE
jgi:Transposase zinc-binding domain